MELNPDSVIDERKLKEYLFTPRIEDDKSKFLALGGFSLANWHQVEQHLRRQLEQDAVLIHPDNSIW